MKLFIFSNLSSFLFLTILFVHTGCEPSTTLQTGKGVGDDIVVTLDNPDFTESNVPLVKSITKWNGPMAREIDVTGLGFTISNGDFRVETWQGDGPAKTNGVSAYAAVSDERLPARPEGAGHYGSDQPPAMVNLNAQGLRIGFNPLLVRLYQIEPDRSMPTDFSTVRVRLDPAVALVPIEVVVVYHDKNPQGLLNNGMEQQRLKQQLGFWDHFPVVETTNITDAQFGELTSVTHVMPWYSRDKDGLYWIATQLAPDMIWHRCGVQFRLVNYFELQVPTRNVVPVRGFGQDMDKSWPDGTFDDAPLRENLALARRDPRHMDGTVTVIFMNHVGFSDAPEVGRALSGLNAIGVSLTDGSSTDAVVGHELGHLSGLRDATGEEKDAKGNPMYDVMVGLGPGITPTDAECTRMKKWADSFVKFWTTDHGSDHP